MYSLANIDGRAALVAGDQWYDLEALSAGEAGPDPMAALGAPDRLSALTRVLDQHDPGGVLDPARLVPPVPRPRNVFAIGLNYQAHADEGSMEVPDNPLVFTKFSSCLVGPTADVEMRSDAVDYEGELVAVIGPGGKDIEPADAWDHVVGLMVGQDLSDRAVQFAAKPPHFDLGKSFDTFGPVGPVMVSPDSVDRDRLRIVTEQPGGCVAPAPPSLTVILVVAVPTGRPRSRAAALIDPARATSRKIRTRRGSRLMHLV